MPESPRRLVRALESERAREHDRGVERAGRRVRGFAGVDANRREGGGAPGEHFGIGGVGVDHGGAATILAAILGRNGQLGTYDSEDARSLIRRLLTVLLLGSAHARASPRVPVFADDPAAAQALFTEAKKLMSAGKYADACPKLEESERSSPAIGTKFNLADCYEHTGRMASAWAEFLSVASAAKNANQGAREKAARDRAKALEPKLSRIAIVVPDASAVTGLEVKRDDDVVGSGQWGEALPVDPGQHTLTARAPGKRPWKTIVEVAGAGGAAKVIVPPLDDEPAPAPAPVRAAPAVSAASPQPADADSSSALRPAGGSSSAWVPRSSSREGSSGRFVRAKRTRCQASVRTTSARRATRARRATSSNGKMYDDVSVAFFAVGGAAVVAGAALLIFGGHSSASTTARLLPSVGPQGGGLRLVGSF